MGVRFLLQFLADRIANSLRKLLLIFQEHSKSANIARQSSTQKAVPAYDSSKKPKAPEVVRLQAPKPLDKPRVSLPASLNDMPESSSNKRPLQSPLSSPERHSKKKKTETPDNAEYAQLEKKFNEQKEEVSGLCWLLAALSRKFGGYSESSIAFRI
jgi:hypothetical protein